MKMSPAEIAAELEAIAVLVPALLADRDDFPSAFEDLTQGLLGRVEPRDHGKVLDALAVIVEGSGFNYVVARRGTSTSATSSRAPGRAMDIPT